MVVYIVINAKKGSFRPECHLREYPVGARVCDKERIVAPELTF